MEAIFKIQSLFGKVTMDDASHTYFIEGKRLKGSVSTLLKRYCVPFNVEKQAPYSARKEGVSVEQIRAKWNNERDISVIKGHKTHTFAEKYAFDGTHKPSNIYEEAAKRFIDNLPPFIRVISVEVKMYHFQYGFPGTMDLLLFDLRNQTFIIADWKTNKDLFKNYKGQTLTGPFTHLLDNPFNKYQLQLSFYQILFEQTGYKVSNRMLIWIRPDGEYEAWDTEDFTEQLKADIK